MSELTNYLPVSRQIFNHEFWTEERSFSRFEAWTDLLQTARFEEAETRKLIGNTVVKWGRGELVASLRYLAERWGWSKNKVDSFLKLLISEQMIAKRTANGTPNTVITICKYDVYNSNKKSKGQQTGHERDRTGTASGQDRDKTKKVNNVNKVNKENVRDLVTLTHPEIEKLKNEFGNEAYEWMVDKLHYAKGANNKLKYDSDYMAIRKWVVGAFKEQKLKEKNSGEKESRVMAIMGNHEELMKNLTGV